MRVAVVGHVEWIEFARVPVTPEPGAIVHASEVWEEPGGGGAVSAVQLARLAGGALFLTALGDDQIARRVEEALPGQARRRDDAAGEPSAGAAGTSEAAVPRLELAVARRPMPQRRGFVHVDARGERTITVVGDRMGPSGADDLPWHRLDGCDAVYVTAGDAAALRHARTAKIVVGTARALPTLAEAGIRVDALVASASDPGERYERGDLDIEPAVVVRTEGAAGGSWETASGDSGSWRATPLPGSVEDAYGCGDSFAAGLTYALGAGLPIVDAVRLGARCGAACLTGRGPYTAQLTANDL